MKSSGGTAHFVATDFNPLKVNKINLAKTPGIYYKATDFKKVVWDFDKELLT